MQEHYFELVIKVSSHHSLFLDFLADTLPVGFEEIDDGFIIRSEDEVDTIIWGLEQFREALQKATGDVIELEYKQSKLKNSDWVKVYQDSIEPLRIDKFYIHPTWDAPDANLINIAIDPALAFGTGHHPTTASALRAIAKYVKEDDKVLDVGCGSGILGVGAIKLGAVVDACDTDIACIENSQLNSELNNVKFNKLWEGSCSFTKDRYDVVVANIVADVLIFIANDLKSVVKEDGVLVLSGILEKYESKVLKFYQNFEILEKITQDEWVTFILKQGKK
ncbi:LSU ribosomal protein L11P methyltransferase [Sulfurimonas denitrificans DSM 1251]|uniref:Ribosomal protein L11 methyltransferase n=1 Tax=Sulfurimonas denitrificans (strain ATCC 33889 / DSM 1251) TaxID=326298 RepID=Q30PY3_SULDN|nr:50S ribosomal protein L11 methyltransferase [Sulfurimonas denitrificans]ABB44948.1 LSU ribosomal protein L11P methyltransferase [Sulfurimonas denitrificans DSM 1251]MDD3442650.1 50S ribosomal protein L11 methyltransferase [Sulfurimonas denitrificans]